MVGNSLSIDLSKANLKSHPVGQSPELADGPSREAALLAEIASLRSRVKQLEEQQPRYRDIFGSHPQGELSKGFFVPTGSWDWDLASNEVFWSDELYGILGYEKGRDRPSAEAFAAALHPEDRPAMEAAIVLALKEGVARRTAVRVLIRDGSIRHLQTEGIVIRNGLGQAVRMMGIIIDATEFSGQAEANWRSNQLLHEAQVLADAGSLVWNLDEGWMELSEGARHIAGLPPKPRITVAEAVHILHPEDRASMLGYMDKAMRDTDLDIIEIEYRILRPDGEVRQILQRSRKLDGGAGSARMRLSTVLDVTHTRQTEDALRRSNQLLQEAQLLGQSGYWIWNLDNGKVQWSDTLCDFTGMQVGGEKNIRALVEHVHPEDRTRVGMAMQAAMHGAAQMTTEFRVILPNGSVRHILQRSRPYDAPMLGAGRVRLGTMVDITDLRRAEARLEQEHYIAETAMRLVKAGSWVYDPCSESVTWSDDLYALFGVPLATKVTHEFFSSLVHPDDLYQVHQLHHDLLSLSGLQMRTIRILRPDNGETRYFEIKGDWVGGKGDSKMGRIFVGINIDITERLRLDAAQRQQQKLEVIGRLAGGVAHDFNNLLTVILGHAEELDEEAPHARLGQILKAGRLGAALTQRLLAFSRQAVVRPQKLDLSALIQSMASLLERLLGDEITVEFDLSEELPQISADVGQVEQVLLNLAINARDAMPQGGRLMVKTRHMAQVPDMALPRSIKVEGERVVDSYVMLSVEDTGTGMPIEVIERLFEPFFTTKDIGKGTGLGLSTVLSILTEARGRIALHNQPGRGARFEVFWPSLVEEEDIEPALPVSIIGMLHQEASWVVVVEDNHEFRRLLVEMLESGGHAVQAYATSEAAMSMDDVTLTRVVALVTDIVLPGAPGQRVAQSLRERKPSLAVLFISGYPRLDLEEPIEGEFLQKPFNRMQLLNTVEGMLKPQ